MEDDLIVVDDIDDQDQDQEQDQDQDDSGPADQDYRPTRAAAAAALVAGRGRGMSEKDRGFQTYEDAAPPRNPPGLNAPPVGLLSALAYPGHSDISLPVPPFPTDTRALFCTD